MTLLSHQNVAKLHTFFEDTSAIYLTQELCDCGDLCDIAGKLWCLVRYLGTVQGAVLSVL